MKLGILGGSFNPIHIGHLLIAEEVYNVHNLSKVIFIPVNLPPHKDVNGLVEPMHRYQMVKEATKGIGHFEVSDAEIKRTGKSFTIDTIQFILNAYGNKCEIYLIIGADSLNELKTWKNIKMISEICKIVTINRPGYNIDALDDLENILSKDGVANIKKLMIHIPPVDISATEIRNNLKNGYSIKDWTPLAVNEYIKKHLLYTDLRPKTKD
ncbi:MAG: nicotinate-nucleotide adenylyltransferase [Candidatus Anammoxibacter sp.]